jgi:deoxyribonuclease V
MNPSSRYGVAKTAFRSATHAIEIRRGSARRPLYVTAAGLSIREAADPVQTMAGPFRMPAPAVGSTL